MRTLASKRWSGFSCNAAITGGSVPEAGDLTWHFCAGSANDGEQVPCVRYAFEFVFSSVLEFGIRPDDAVLDGR